MIDAAFLFAYHVNMRLQDDRIAVFITVGRRLVYDNVIYVILFIR